MKNLAVSVFAVLLSLALNWVSPATNILVIIVITSFVLLWLLYQAQLLPEDTMAYLDNRIIHDGQKTTEDENIEAFGEAQKSELNYNIRSDMSDDIAHAETEKRMMPDEELLNFVIEKSGELNVKVHPLEGLSEWLSEVDQKTAEREILLLIEKMRQASGLSESVNLNFFEASLEVHV